MRNKAEDRDRRQNQLSNLQESITQNKNLRQQIKNQEMQEALHNLDLQNQFIRQRDQHYEQHRVDICQKTRDMYNHFIVSCLSLSNLYMCIEPEHNNLSAFRSVKRQPCEHDAI
jgi:hypothetical protein